jgi:hypothetical protein
VYIVLDGNVANMKPTALLSQCEERRPGRRRLEHLDCLGNANWAKTEWPTHFPRPRAAHGE